MANEVVAHYLNGRIVKGVSLDVDPGRPKFHVRTVSEGTLEVKLTELKALFFVKDLVGDAQRKDVLRLDAGDGRARGSFPIELEFADGERLVGLTVRYPPVRPFFFVLPADPASNNVRILINRAAVKRMSQPPPPAA
ncbi:MAG TPA: hypothetical protein VG500_01735 [Gemmatimonadales bacterium]|jgi:hypothetical protein|nr:hypothetical protein [Gemmatimonadales bacterium]